MCENLIPTKWSGAIRTPFNMLIVGGTECVKTHFLLEFLENNYKGYFDYRFLTCPTFIRNKTYRDWVYKDDEKLFAIPCDHDQGII